MPFVGMRKRRRGDDERSVEILLLIRLGVYTRELVGYHDDERELG